MITLVGFATSNYYNKVKLALLEKEVPFSEQLNWATKDEATLLSSPLGKVPFVMTDNGPLAESQVIMDYLEAKYPAKPLIPADPYAAAKVREICAFLELHLELVARRLYPFAFFGKPRDEAVAESTKKELVRNIAAFAKMTKFSPYLRVIISRWLTALDSFIFRCYKWPPELCIRKICWPGFPLSPT
jgi:glutathione S-transferase